MNEKIFNVKSIPKTFRRLGMAFNQNGTEFMPGELTDDQIAALRAEPKLKCWYADPTPDQREWIASRVLVAVDPGAGIDVSSIAVAKDGKVTVLGIDEGIAQALLAASKSAHAKSFHRANFNVAANEAANEFYLEEFKAAAQELKRAEESGDQDGGQDQGEPAAPSPFLDGVFPEAAKESAELATKAATKAAAKAAAKTKKEEVK